MQKSADDVESVIALLEKASGKRRIAVRIEVFGLHAGGPH